MDVFIYVLGMITISFIFYFFSKKMPDVFAEMINEKFKESISRKLEESRQDFEELQQQQRIDNEKSLNDLRNSFEIEYQNTEQDFQLRMEYLKKGFTVLPELYWLIQEASANVDQLDIESDYKEIKKKYAGLKNFIAKNIFFLDSGMYELAKKCENSINDHISIKKKLIKMEGEQIQNLLDELNHIISTKEESIKNIEEAIRKKLA
ncbi:hypothetical protein AB6831_04235 [Carnobacterium divergens]|uniref:hypothetical protein n=1 Tax=Carnobacterium divergens TaxID=2748 RepID=UPI0039C9140A